MTPQELLSYNLPLFEGLSPIDFAGIPLSASEQDLEPWQRIYNQDDLSDDLYFLLSGSLLAVFWTTQGREIVFSRFSKGSYFGELTAFGGGPRSLAVIAKTKAQVLDMKRQKVAQQHHARLQDLCLALIVEQSRQGIGMEARRIGRIWRSWRIWGRRSNVQLVRQVLVGIAFSHGRINKAFVMHLCG